MKLKTIKARLLPERKVITISDGKIKTVNIGTGRAVARLLVVLWCLFATVAVLLDRSTISKKNKVIAELRESHRMLSKDYKDIDLTLQNLKDYLTSLNKYDRFNNVDLQKLGTEPVLLRYNFNDKELASITPVLHRVDLNLRVINENLKNRVSGMDGVMEQMGLNNIHPVAYTVASRDINSEEIAGDSILKKNKTIIDENVNYLLYLEDFINNTPIAKPLEDYRVTSKFGSRMDPFKSIRKTHHGLDFAGPLGSRILAPADGVVISAQPRSGYGNHIIIDHGHKITSEYGHLKEYLVKVGDRVKRGQAIAIQGNTGRSTGPHLHYEIRYNKKPVDPDNFIKVGSQIL